MYLILPLKLGPHGPELGVRAAGWHDVIHDVDVDVIQNDTHAVADSSANVIHYNKQSDHQFYRSINCTSHSVTHSAMSTCPSHSLSHVYLPVSLTQPFSPNDPPSPLILVFP